MMRLYYKKAKVISGVLNRIMNISGRKYVRFPLNLSIKRITDDFYIAKNEITVKDKAFSEMSTKLWRHSYLFGFRQEIKLSGEGNYKGEVHSYKQENPPVQEIRVIFLRDIERQQGISRHSVKCMRQGYSTVLYPSLEG